MRIRFCNEKKYEKMVNVIPHTSIIPISFGVTIACIGNHISRLTKGSWWTLRCLTSSLPLLEFLKATNFWNDFLACGLIAYNFWPTSCSLPKFCDILWYDIVVPLPIWHKLNYFLFCRTFEKLFINFVEILIN